MINTFYQALLDAQNWFFGGTLMSDPFFGFVIQVFNAFLLLVIFYSLFLFPLRYCIKLFKRWIQK